MIYKGNNSVDAEKAIKRLESLIKNGKTFEINEKSIRSLSQNNYLHLIISYLALVLGYDSDYVKQAFFKIEANKDIFVRDMYNSMTHKNYTIVRSTKDLTTEEMKLAIDRFRNFSSIICDVYLPSPTDYKFLDEINYETNKNKQYL